MAIIQQLAGVQPAVTGNKLADSRAFIFGKFMQKGAILQTSISDVKELGGKMQDPHPPYMHNQTYLCEKLNIQTEQSDAE